MTVMLRERSRTDPVWCAFCRLELAVTVIEGKGTLVVIGPACLERLRADLADTMPRLARESWRELARTPLRP